MSYSANLPKKYRSTGKNEIRTNDKVQNDPYPYTQEGLPGNNKVINQYLSSEAIFYSIEDVMQLTGWSRKVVQRLFNAEDFPYTDLGKRKLVEAHALVGYFAVQRLRPGENHWD